MFCALLGQDIRLAFTGQLVLWLTYLTLIGLAMNKTVNFSPTSTFGMNISDCSYTLET